MNDKNKCYNDSISNFINLNKNNKLIKSKEILLNKQKEENNKNKIFIEWGTNWVEG